MGMIVPLSPETHCMEDMDDAGKALFSRGSLNPPTQEVIESFPETRLLVERLLPKDDSVTEEEYRNIIANCIQTVAAVLEDAFSATPVNNVLGPVE